MIMLPTQEPLSIVVVTPTRDEYSALARLFPQRRSTYVGTTAIETLDLETVLGPLKLSLACIGGQGITLAADWTSSLLSSTRPDLCILAGIAGVRFDSDCRLWDLSIASGAFDYSIVESRPKGHPRPSGRPVPTSPDIQKLIAWLALAESDLIAGAGRLLANNAITTPVLPNPSSRRVTAVDPKLRVAILQAVRDQRSYLLAGHRQFLPLMFASGNELHKDADRLQELTGHDKRICGVEMEFAGFAPECARAAVPSLMVKAISDMVGCRKAGPETIFATHVAAAGIHTLLEASGFVEWLSQLTASRLKAARRLTMPDGRAAEANLVMERIVSRKDDAPYQTDPSGMAADALAVERAVTDGYLSSDDVARRVEPVTALCTGCGRGLERAKPMMPLTLHLANAIPLVEPLQIGILLNPIRATFLSGDVDGAYKLVKRTHSPSVQRFLRLLPIERLRGFLISTLEVEGFGGSATDLLKELIEAERSQGSLIAAKGARCLACKAASARLGETREFIGLAIEYARNLSDNDKLERQDLLKSLAIISLFDEWLQSTPNPWNDDLPPEWKKKIQRIRRMPDGEFPVRAPEAAWMALVAFRAAHEDRELVQARSHLRRVSERGKRAHCLFNIDVLSRAVGLPTA